MHDEIVENYGLETTRTQLYRGKRKTMEAIEGNHAKAYTKLLMYVAKVLRTNPAIQHGFKEGCKPFIAVDGCHLKGPFGGILSAAVGLDGNNGLYPVAIAVEESECKDNWAFFLYHLNTIFGNGLQNMSLTIMSDGQKSIELAMRQMLELSSEAHIWLSKFLVKIWARHTFDHRVKSEHVTSNMVESFNNWIGNVRGKPILTLLENIKLKLMNKLHKRFEEATSWQSLVTPNIKKKLDEVVLQSRLCKVTFARQKEY
ncbi:uncharacterized protein LOC114306047 [Camellia sinensis]|uniref:uncharacterized protein LOC114306047 n=1 Tax=Camellia sinensis TaxID=4442 RepID=UPI001035DC07|nr:uncharacterized protein LOC114306047 [Camellia sinensis]